MGRHGKERRGEDRNGVNRQGKEWNGMDWIGVDRMWLERRGKDLSILAAVVAQNQGIKNERNRDAIP